MKFTVKDRHIKHDGKVYAPGNRIDLTVEEAGRLGYSVEQANGADVAPVDIGEKREGKKGK